MSTAARPGIFRSAAIFSAVSLAVYVVGFGKSLLVSRYFGTEAAMDAYGIGVMIPNILGNLIAGSCAGALLPVLPLAEQEGGLARANLFRGCLLWIIIAAVAAASLLALFASPVLHLMTPRFGAERFGLAVSLLRIASPLVVLSAIQAFCAAELMSRSRFALAAFAPAFYHLGPILAVLFFHRSGVVIMVWGAIAGGIAQAMLVALPALWANPAPPRLELGHPLIRRVFSAQSKLLLVSVFSVSFNFVDQAMAALLPPGNVSALNYANALDNVIEQSLITASASVLLVQFSIGIAAGDLMAVREQARRSVRTLVLVAAPLTVLVLGAGETGIRLVFQHGAFTPESTRLVYAVWAGYILGLVPYAAGIVAARLLNALEAQGLLARLALVTIPLNAVLDYLLMQQFGVFGIAVSTSLVYVVSSLAMFSLLRSRIGNLLDPLTIQISAKATFISLVAGVPFLAARLLAPADWRAAAGAAIAFLLLVPLLYRTLALDRELPPTIQQKFTQFLSFSRLSR